MYINRFFRFCALTMALAGCGAMNGGGGKWTGDDIPMITGTPAAMQYGSYSDGYATGDRRIAVLLPLSGQNASLGQGIRTSIEMAILSAGAENLTVSFHDTAADANAAIDAALYTNPGVIIGPVFANDARMLRNVKPEMTPALSFTSDATAVGGGVMTMALMPTNSIEAISREMYADGTRATIIIAPDTASGRLMAGIARRAAEINNITTTGIFFYTEKDTDSIKSMTMAASMNAARVAANNRAREILSDILTNETLSAVERSAISRQLENLARVEVTGKLPYDAIMFLGGADDTKSAVSFLRYYGVNARDARLYGTAMWDGTDLASDFTMSGAKYAALPEINAEFAAQYEQVAGTAPTRIAGFGYDAANMAMGMLYSDASNAAYLLNPSGYVGTDGVMRLRPTGDSERGLRIMRLDGSGTATEVRPAPDNFITPIYNIEQRHISPATAMSLATAGVNPVNYIQIPDRLRGKYRSKTYGATYTAPVPGMRAETVTILPEDDSDAVVAADFQPKKLDTVNRTYIDSIEIEE